MFNKATEIIKKEFVKIYFGLLFILLSILYFPTFFYPPRSDHWPALYFFYRINSLLGGHKWQYVLTYDPLIRVTFRPLSILVPYFEKTVFGSQFFFFQIVTFCLYYVSIVLLYKLATYFCKNKVVIIIFLGLFAVLFSHFDLVCWSFQSHIILSFCLFIAGFIVYIQYIQLKHKILLLAVITLFLSGMLAYEVFIFWPLAVILLSYIFGSEKKKPHKNIRLPISCVLVILSTYTLYVLFFFLNRTFKAYQDLQISLEPLFLFSSIVFTLFLVFFNILYNTILVNMAPQIALPLLTDDNNLNMGGLITSGYFDMSTMIFIGGSLVIVALVAAFWFLYRKRKAEVLKGYTFFMFLLFSELFVLFYLKSLTDTSAYNLTQFRFQYIPNALFFLMLILFIDGLVKLSRKNKIIIAIIVSLVFVINIRATAQGIHLLNSQLQPLEKLLTNIRTGFKKGYINPENRLYLNDAIARKLPPLCWNREMGKRCMRGTYQWIFSEKEIKCFAPLENAQWVISDKDLSIVNK